MTFSPTTAALLVVIGVAVGAFGTIVGSGGGFILTPVLLLLYPHDRPATITAISLTAVFFNAASGSAAYAHAEMTPVIGVIAQGAAAATRPPTYARSPCSHHDPTPASLSRKV